MALGPDMIKTASAATKIFKIIEEPSEINAVKMDEDPKYKRLDPTTVQGKIEFKDVWFRYPSRKDDFVLKGLSLTINPNESVALVGESGCGKSTFVNLMMRFYDPNFGEILLDGVNIQEYNLHDLRKALSLVMQEPSIFNYSIKDNLLYGNLEAKNSEIMEVAKVSNCSEFIDQGRLESIDDTNAGLLKELENNSNSYVAIWGQEEYQKQIDVLKKLVELDAKKGDF
jgi:ATP-binding cassette subfamily B (MDR/TAP) protein 1